MGSLLLVGGLFAIAAASIFDRTVVRRTGAGTPEHRLRRGVHLVLLAVGFACVAYGIWHLRGAVPSSPDV